MYRTTKPILILMTALYGLSANASIIENGSFEASELNRGAWSVFDQIPGWQTVSGAGIEIQNNTIVNAQDGAQYVELDSHNNSAMTQQLDGLSVGAAYDFSFWYRARTNGGNNDNGINVYWGASSLEGLIFEISDVKARDGGWTEYVMQVSPVAETMFLSFAASGLNNSLGGFVDNVTLTSRIAEPHTYLLFAMGVFGLYNVRKRYP